MNDNLEQDKMRIDKWLWAARFFKTRSLAADAVDSGKALLNGARVKPAKTVAVGDELSVRIGPFQYRVAVLALSGKRGPAPEARKLYRETDLSLQQRTALAADLKAQPEPIHKGRPTKRDRRVTERFRGGG
ncbi:MAG: RNA-binding S4 domain-containing protein [Burkholderiales bacterium]